MAKQVYVLRAKLKGWRGVRRTIAMRSEHTLSDLHGALQTAFEWDDEHLYAFWLGGKFWAPGEVEYVHPLALEDRPLAALGESGQAPRRRSAERPLGELRLMQGQRIAYVFDFRSEWRVRLTLREFTADDGGHYPRVLESVGQAPSQYLDYEQLSAA
jgi:hypothetical protein